MRSSEALAQFGSIKKQLTRLLSPTANQESTPIRSLIEMRDEITDRFLILHPSSLILYFSAFVIRAHSSNVSVSARRCKSTPALHNTMLAPPLAVTIS